MDRQANTKPLERPCDSPDRFVLENISTKLGPYLKTNQFKSGLSVPRRVTPLSPGSLGYKKSATEVQLANGQNFMYLLSVCIILSL